MEKEEILMDLEFIKQNLIPVITGGITDSSWMRPKLISFKERIRFAEDSLAFVDNLIKKLNSSEKTSV